MEAATIERSAQGAVLPREARVVIVGAGFSGLGMAIRLVQAGIDDFVVLERADDVGGTWRDNTYPGCACDVPSHLYSFSFAPNPDWSRTYSPPGRDLGLPRRCADEHGVTAHMRFGHEMLDAAWDETEQRWRVETSQGALRTRRSWSLGTGGLSEPSVPDLPGLERLRGQRSSIPPAGTTTTTSRGERVAVVGTGASAIQFVPQIQPRVAQPALFQRTPPWVMPRPDRDAIRRCERRGLPRASGRPARHARRDLLAAARRSCRCFIGNRTLVQHRRRAVARRHLARAGARPRAAREADARLPDRLQAHPDLQRLLPGARATQRRGRDRAASARWRRARSSTADGTERAVDTIIFGTGFHVTDLPVAEHVRGRGGPVARRALARRARRPTCGTTVAGFPNLFLLVGPNTGLGHNSIVFMIEAQLALHPRRAAHDATSAARPASRSAPEAQAAFNDDVQRAHARARSGRPAAARAGISMPTAATPRCGPATPGTSAASPAASTPRATGCSRPRPSAFPSPPEHAPLGRR